MTIIEKSPDAEQFKEFAEFIGSFLELGITKFGDETVDSAFNVSLKVGIPKAKLQKLMLSDHFIEHKMDMKNLGGFMRFLNCPIYGSHIYVEDKLNTKTETSQLFCKSFCKAHAQDGN